MSDVIRLRSSVAGKGDKRRPEDAEKVRENWDRIFPPKKQEG